MKLHWKIAMIMAAVVAPVTYAVKDTFLPTTMTIEYIPDDYVPSQSYNVEGDLSIELATDKACYRPGETVTFTASKLRPGLKVRYRHLSNIIKEDEMKSDKWQWTTPANNFIGYMIDLYEPVEGGERVYGSIAVDVSTDWKRYPRYGFVATFDRSKTKEGVIENEMAYLSRCHINCVQYQDWHYKHHWPLGGWPGQLLPVYRDVANREVYTSVLQKYIDIQHSLGMKTMFYNLCYGALEDGEEDGVSPEWYVYTDDHHENRDFHDLPDSWKSNIYVLDAANPRWQKYLASRNDDVYKSFDFDGFHVDQLGWRGDRWDYYGNRLEMDGIYGYFLEAMKKAHPDKSLVMNTVGTFGIESILRAGVVDVAYNELWWGEPNYDDLHRLVQANEYFGGRDIKTVFAAYMNYAVEEGTMNTPGVLLTDAVMMALGAAHLELGDGHMLCREYFPADMLEMTDELRNAMVKYYDFATAYEELLQGGCTEDEIEPAVTYCGTDGTLRVNQWPPQTGAITAYARKIGNRSVYHMLNFITAETLSWRDIDGTRPYPLETLGIPLEIVTDEPVQRVWAASPDYCGGVLQPLDFSIDGNRVRLTLPALKYWTMIVLE